MTDDDIQRGLALCEAATPGPWHGTEGCAVFADGMQIVADTFCSGGTHDNEPPMRMPWTQPQCVANAAFAAEARTLLPAALHEVQRLRGELEQARGERDKLRGLVGEALGEAREGYSRGWDGLDRRDATERLARIARDGGVE